MTTTQTAKPATYRKTKAGEWVAFAPFVDVAHAELVTVAKKDGTTKVETIERLGRPFTVEGTEMVYCYLAKTARCSEASRRHHPRQDRSGKKASASQVDYAMRLIENDAWHDSDIGQGTYAPTVSELESMSSADISEIIADLKGAY